MNRQDFNQAGGFPFEVDSIIELIKSYSVFNSLGELAGNKTIIKGCTLTGSTVSDGFVYLNGEVFAFKGGTQTSSVKIYEVSQSKEFENGQIKPVYFERYVGFGSGAGSIPWSDFNRNPSIYAINETLKDLATNTSVTALVNRVDELEKKNAVFIQSGAMVLWNKPANQIPEGWEEVVDWRGRMPVGFDPTQADFDSIGKTGGAKQKTGNISFPYTGFGSGGGNTSGGSTGRLIVSTGNSEIGESFESIAKASSASTGNVNIDVLNPYRTVLFIEYIGNN